MLHRFFIPALVLLRLAGFVCAQDASACSSDSCDADGDSEFSCTTFHVCAGSTGWGDRILQLWTTVALDETLGKCGAPGSSGNMCTFWRMKDTTSPWPKKGAKYGRLPKLNDTCSAVGAKVDLSWKEAVKHTDMPGALRVMKVSELERRLSATKIGRVVRTAGWWDLFPSSAFTYFREAGVIPAGCPYEAYLSSWLSAAQATKASEFTLPLLPWYAQRPYPQAYIVVHLRRGDKADPQHAHIYRHLNSVRTRTAEAIKYMCAHTFEHRAVSNNFCILGDASPDEVDAFESVIREAGCVVLEDVPVRERMEAAKASQMHVDWHIMARAAGIIQSVSHDGYSSFSYAAAVSGALEPIPLLSVHPTPTKTVYADARYDAITYGDGVEMVTQYHGLERVYHLPPGGVEETSRVLDTFLEVAQRRFYLGLEKWV